MMTTQEETVDVTETETESRQRKRSWKRDRGGKPRRKDENMVRFFFNLGKKDHLKKLDVLDIINKATAGGKTKKELKSEISKF
jgi:hypothetical protein